MRYILVYTMFLHRLILALDQNEVDYAIVGGLAVALHGAIRGTVDIDIVIQLSENDFVNAERVFLLLGLEPKLPIQAKHVFHFREDYIKNRNLIAWSFFNPVRPLEIVDVIISHDRKKMKVKKIAAFGTTIKVATIPELIKMKGQSARPQDLSDIEALKKLLEMK
jgi:hypothetical protein